MEDLKIIEKIRKEYEDYKDVLAIYAAYKSLKKELGKPERYPLDPQKIEEDLSSAEFFKLVKELKRSESIERGRYK